MSIMTPEVLRTVHEDRRQQLLHEAQVRRVHREFKAARRAERPARRPGGWLRALTGRRVRYHDAKVARLVESWLELDHRTARLLAGVADEVDVPAGTALVPGRFSYIGVDVAHRGLVVTVGTPPLTLESAATVLILATRDLDRIEHDVPRLASLRSGSPAPAHTDIAAEVGSIDHRGPIEPAPTVDVGDGPDDLVTRIATMRLPTSVTGFRDDRPVAECVPHR